MAYTCTCRSGIEEDYGERQILLEEIAELKEEAEKLRKDEDRKEKEREVKAKEVRKRAMECLRPSSTGTYDYNVITPV